MRTCLFITSFILNIYQIRYTRFFSKDKQLLFILLRVVLYRLLEFFYIYFVIEKNALIYGIKIYYDAIIEIKIILSYCQ